MELARQTKRKSNSESPFDLNRAVYEVELAVEAALREGKSKHSQDPTRVKRLRISGFPFCPVSWFMGLPRALSKTSLNDMSSAYFTTVGTAVHGVIQSALEYLVNQELRDPDLKVLRVNLLGDWECADRTCRHVHPLQTHPGSCAKCGNPHVRFEEVTLEDGVALGHVDTIFEFILSKPTKEFPQGKLWLVIDYKTSMLKRVWASEASMELPYVENVYQIRGYVSVLAARGYPVYPAGFLVYVPRDNPFKFRVFGVPADVPREKKRLRSYQDSFADIASATTLEDVHDIVDRRPCRERLLPQHKDCKWKEYCATAENVDRIKHETSLMFKRLEGKLPVVSVNDLKALLQKRKSNE